MRHLPNLTYLASLLLVCLLAGCAARPEVLSSADSRDDSDPVWSSYHFKGPMPRAYFHGAFGGWYSTGAEVTPADIARAPTRVVLGRYRASCYDPNDDTIYLDERARVSVLWHESQHCVDWHHGIRDRRELERRAMIAEMGGTP